MLDGLAPFQRLAGTTVHWGRLGRGGTRYLMPDFLGRLQAAFAELWEVSGLGPAEAIVSAGAYVDRPVKPGDRHAIGTAIDICEIHWTGQPPLVASRAPQDARRYLGAEAILRRQVPQILDWWTNADHHSHWHLDDRPDAEGVQLGHRADVLFLQAALVHLYERDIAIDGRMGPLTRSALRDAIGRPADELDQEGWREWLLSVARRGFGG